MSPNGVAGVKFRNGAAGVIFGLVAHFDTSELSAWYSTRLSVSMVMITGVWPLAEMQHVAAARMVSKKLGMDRMTTTLQEEVWHRKKIEVENGFNTLALT